MLRADQPNITSGLRRLFTSSRGLACMAAALALVLVKVFKLAELTAGELATLIVTLVGLYVGSGAIKDGLKGRARLVLAWLLLGGLLSASACAPPLSAATLEMSRQMALDARQDAVESGTTLPRIKAMLPPGHSDTVSAGVYLDALAKTLKARAKTIEQLNLAIQKQSE